MRSEQIRSYFRTDWPIADRAALLSISIDDFELPMQDY